MIGPITLFTLLLIQCASSSFVANVTAERTLIFKGSCHKKSRLYTSRIIASVSLHSKLQFIFESLPFYSVFIVFCDNSIEDTCPSGAFGAGGECYFFSHKDMNWYEAQEVMREEQLMFYQQNKVSLF